MKVSEILELLKRDGWSGTLNSILEQAGLKK
jgi:predicted RNA binding protein YcfA (HicA-like mRNA interferase family)